MHTKTVNRGSVQLYCEVRGEGPSLIFIPGGPQDAGVFADIADTMARDRTVLTFDPRGNSRSVIAGDGTDLEVDEHAADVAAIIDAFGSGQADVFGTSGGAQIAMALAVRFPAAVRSMVLHEPPTVCVLDDPAEAIAADQAIVDVYRAYGVEAGIGAFFGMAEMDGLSDVDHEPGSTAGGEIPPVESESAATMMRVMGNFDFFLGHGMMSLSLYQPDFDELVRSGKSINVGIGETSTQAAMRDIAGRLATRLSAPLVTFPGDHSGFAEQSAEFAAVLKTTLGRRTASR